MTSKIVICENTKKNLAKIGSKGMTWSQIIDDLIEHANRCQFYVEERQ